MQENSGKSKSMLEQHYEQFLQTGNKRQFLVGLYRETHSYCLRRLSQDPDVVGDFILHLLEGRIDQIVEEFQRRRHPSFPAFYLLCLRNSFQNFIRKYRRTHMDTLPLQGDLLDTDHSSSFNREEFWQRLEQGLQNLSGLDCLLFKIYHSIPLNADNLKYMIEDYGPERSLEIVNSLESRRRFRENRLQLAEERINRFYSRAIRANYRMESGRRRADVQTYLNRHWAHSIYSVATLLGISRQLAAFRLRRSTRCLREHLQPFALQELRGDL